MRRVLLITSSYRPAMLADMQRARMLSWELPALGWEVEVLAPAAGEIRTDALEPDHAGFFPAIEMVHEAGSLLRTAFELIGSRSPAWRTLRPMDMRARALLKSGRFDLVYFSTTTFSYLPLGERWKKKFGVPYVLDLHDPWVRSDSASGPKGWRARVAGAVHARMERSAVVNAAGLVAVSPAYLEAMKLRYESLNPGWLASARHAVIPFGALASDLVEAARMARPPDRGESRDIRLHYVGAGGPIMVRSFSLLCRALASLRKRNHSLVDRVRVRLFGTTYDWKPGKPKALEAAAWEAGVGDLVEENPERVSYRRSLELLLESDGALILGVDDSGYMPSKLFGYALSGKPLLASLRQDGPAYAFCRDNPELGRALRFGGADEMSVEEASRVIEAFLQDAAQRRIINRREVLEPYLAPAMARRHVELFDACLKPAAVAA